MAGAWSSNLTSKLNANPEKMELERPDRKSSLQDQKAELSREFTYRAVRVRDHEDEEEEKDQRSWGFQVLEGSIFQNTMAMVIVANGIVMGLETDFTEWRHLYKVVEQVFMLIFLAELLFKICVEGLLFFSPSFHDFAWNQFDLIVVGLGVADFISSIYGEGLGGFVSLFRMVRLMRILRLFRLIKALKRLYLLAVGLVEAAKAIVWVTLLMSMVMYICGIVLVKTVGRPPDSDPHHAFLTEHFGSIADAMITLFVLMSSANLPVYQEQVGLLDSHPALTMFLIAFITFGSFGMLGMLTGVINESMFENNELRKDEKRTEHELMREAIGWQSAELFEKLPVDDDGVAAVSDLEKVAQEASELLDRAGVTMSHGDILKFMELMDEDETGCISMKQFVHAMVKIGEGVSPLGMMEITHYICLCNKKLTHSLTQLQVVEDKLEAQMKHTVEQVDSILQVVLKLSRDVSDSQKSSQGFDVQPDVLLSSSGRPSEELKDFESRVVTLLATHSENIGSMLQRGTDRQLEGVEQILTNRVSRQCESVLNSFVMSPTSIGANQIVSSKLDSIQNSVQVLARKEEDRNRDGLQAGTGSFSGAPHLAESRSSQQQDISVALEAQVAALEGKMLSGVAELGGVILSGTADLLCQSQVSLKNELVGMQKELLRGSFQARSPLLPSQETGCDDLGRWRDMTLEWEGDSSRK